MLDSSQLSFVLQGPVDTQFTPGTLQDIRRHFPLSEIIVSTWEGAEMAELICDQIILNKDPGSISRSEDDKALMNANRLYMSSRTGIARASRAFVVKMRSDLNVSNTNLLDCLNRLPQLPARDPDFAFTKDRIIVTNVSTVNPHHYLKMPFHLCDWLCVGRKKDLINLFDIPDYPEKEYAQWYKTHPWPSGMIFPSLARYSTESFLIYKFVNKLLPVSFEHSYDTSNNNIELSERVIANNFVIYNNDQLGIFSHKHVRLDKPSRYWMYTHFDWVNLYNKYCGPEKKIVNLDLRENVRNWYFFHEKKYIPFVSKYVCVLNKILFLGKKLISNSGLYKRIKLFYTTIRPRSLSP